MYRNLRPRTAAATKTDKQPVPVRKHMLLTGNRLERSCFKVDIINKISGASYFNARSPPLSCEIKDLLRFILKFKKFSEQTSSRLIQTWRIMFGLTSFHQRSCPKRWSKIKIKLQKMQWIRPCDLQYTGQTVSSEKSKRPPFLQSMPEVAHSYHICCHRYLWPVAPIVSVHIKDDFAAIPVLMRFLFQYNYLPAI